jgi:hypothetical protein
VKKSSEPPGVVISVRLDARDADILEDLAERSGKTIVQVAREVLHAYLAEHADRQPSTARQG